MALNVITNQMSETVEFIVTKRKSNFDYIKRTHQGKVHWLNVVRLNKANITRFFSPEKLQKRVARWYMLGVSAGRLLSLPEGSYVVRAMCQLFEEYEHFCAHPTTSVRLCPGSPSQRIHINQPAQHDAVKTVIHRTKDKKIVYEYLQTSDNCISGTMDYCEVTSSLCDVMCFIYSKFLDQSCAPNNIHDAILKVDRKVKQLIITKMCHDLTGIAKPLLSLELRGLLNHMFIDESKSNGAGGKKFIALSQKTDNLVANEEDGLDDDFELVLHT